MKLKPEIKNICDEFSNSYEWIENDESLFIKLSNKFVDVVKNRLSKSSLRFQDSQIIGENSILWFRSDEEIEKVYDFEDEEDE